MKLIKKICVILLKTIFGIILFIISYVLVAIMTTLIPVNTKYQMPDSGQAIWISSNGVHTNFVVPMSSKILSWGNFINTREECQYLAIGWGDKEFYMNTPTWKDLKFGTALKAAFWPTDAVLQVYCMESPPSESRNTVKIFLTNNQAKKLNTYIYASFDLNKDGSLKEMIPERGPDKYYKYYSAKGKYSIFFTCNNWTSRGLKLSGIRNSLWAPFDKSVLYHLR
jgi:uncharacterized protein (TIGR02117 family)